MARIGHTDVVPATADDWRHPPFSGHVDDDGCLWGRGAADMKNETATRAVAMAALSRSGSAPAVTSCSSRRPTRRTERSASA